MALASTTTTQTSGAIPYSISLEGDERDVQGEV